MRIFLAILLASSAAAAASDMVGPVSCRTCHAEAYRIWGFRNLSKETMEVLNLWAEFLYEPLVQDKVRPIQYSDDMSYGRKIAHKVHEGLKRTGGVKIPREFPLMDRAAIGLGSVMLHLQAELNFHRLFESMIGKFDEAALAKRQKAALAKVGLA